MASKTVYPFGTNGESTSGISKIVEYNCKAEMFLDNTKPIGTIAKLTDEYKYKKGWQTHDSQVYGIMIQESSTALQYGICLTNSTTNNSISIYNSNGTPMIIDSVNGYYELIDQTSTYFLSGDIYNLIKDGDFVGVPGSPDNEFIRYKIKVGKGRVKYYVYNGHGWNILKNPEYDSIKKLRIVHRCIPFGAKSGFLYVGRIIKGGRVLQNLGNALGKPYPAMRFKNVAGKTIDISKFGINNFVISNDTSYYYSINSTLKTITFTNNCGIHCWVLLKYPQVSNTKYDRQQFGYYVDSSGKLVLVEDNPSISIDDPALPPIVTKEDFLANIRFCTGLAVKSKNGVDLETLETSHRTQRIRKNSLRRATRWVRSRASYGKRHGGVNSHNHESDDNSKNLCELSLRKTCKRYYNSGYSYNYEFCGIFRIRKTNRRKTRFSEWTYWKLLCVDTGNTTDRGDAIVTLVRAYKLKDVYHKILHR